MKITRLFKEFLESEKAGGVILLVCTVISLCIANSQWGSSYIDFWHRHADFSFASVSLNYSLEHWINDGLMAIFFLLVGLEIERELYAGELKDTKIASLPLQLWVVCSFPRLFILYLTEVLPPNRALEYQWLQILLLHWVCWLC